MSQETITQPYTEYDLEILCAKNEQHTANNDLADALTTLSGNMHIRE